MSSIANIATFIDHLVEKNIKINLRDFTFMLHKRFYANIDISIMAELLEIAARDNVKQYIVHHDLLIKYGITINDNIKDRNCMITPKSFLIALQNDSTIYAGYFRFLQTIYSNYQIYQRRCYKQIIGQLAKADKFNISNFIVEFTRLIIPVSVGSDLLKIKSSKGLARYKQFVNTFRSVQHLKIAYMVMFISFKKPAGIRVFYYCTNFDYVRTQISKMYMATTDMIMMPPIALSLKSYKINTKSELTRAGEKKTYTTMLGKGDSILNEYTKILDKIKHRQLRTRRKSRKINQFLRAALPLCQKFLNCNVHKCVKDSMNVYEYMYPSLERISRADFGNEKMTDSIYSLTKISELFNKI